jgi:hypothetical protein
LPKPRSLLISVLSILAIPALAYAHDGPNVFASTPVTPPKGWLWVLPAFLIVYILWDWIILRKTVDTRKFLWLETVHFIEFMAVIFLATAILVIIFGFTGGFLSGLGPPSPVFYGMSRLGSGIFFAVVNVFVLALFLHTKNRLLGKVEPSKASPRKIAMGGAAIVYMLFLIPYLSVGAMTHGNAGGFSRCFFQIRGIIGAPLIQYADANDGRLPESTTFAELTKDIAPYTGSKRNPPGDTLSIICPAEKLFRKDPRSYIWNSSLAGVELVEKDELMSEPVIICPAGHRPLYFGGLLKLKSQMEAEKNKRKHRRQ